MNVWLNILVGQRQQQWETEITSKKRVALKLKIVYRIKSVSLIARFVVTTL